MGWIFTREVEEVEDLRALHVLDCAQNQLTKLDLAGPDLLEILDCSENRLDPLKLDGCTSLREVKSIGNPMVLR